MAASKKNVQTLTINNRFYLGAEKILLFAN